jgi:hypothetical protein
MMKSILYKTSAIAGVVIGVNLVNAGMRLWDAGHYGASVLGYSLAFACYFGASCLMDMFAKSKGGK